MTALLTILSVAFVATACRPAVTPRTAAPETLRSSPAGKLIGAIGTYGDHAWLGIPYAKPPVGDLRWRAPQALAPWDGTREALAPGSPCVQYASPLGGVDGKEGELVGDEDCLYLNIWAPPFAADAVPTDSARLPVMLWIHGGGNTIGDGAFYNGGRLAAEHGVIVISFNYRLGPFGWFRHAALRADGASPDGHSGNFGNLDHISALEWIRDNISAFGGDPGNVTIFGESAGGLNTMALLVAPRAAGLFHRAIAQSGSPDTVPPHVGENLIDADEPGDRNSSNEVVLRLLVAAKIRPDRAAAREYLASMNAPTLERFLREQSPANLMAAYESFGRSGMINMPKLFRDGHVLPAEPIMDGFARPGGHHPVPVMLGTTRDENKLFMFIDNEWVRHYFGIIPRVFDPRMYDLNAEYMAKMWKAIGADEPATTLTVAGNERVFVYRFDWDEEPSRFGIDLAQILGASHGFEIPFVFGHFDLGKQGNMIFTDGNLPGREELSARMRSYWTEFAYNGDPGRGRDGTLPSWEPWHDGAYVVLDTDADGGVRMADETVTRTSIIEALGADSRLAELRDRCRVLRSLALWSRGFDKHAYPTAFDGACADFPIDGYPWG